MSNVEIKYHNSVIPIFMAGVGGCGKTTTAGLLKTMLDSAILAPGNTRKAYASFAEKYPQFADAIDTSRETQSSNDHGRAAIALQYHIFNEYSNHVSRSIDEANKAEAKFVIFDRSPWCHAAYFDYTLSKAASFMTTSENSYIRQCCSRFNMMMNMLQERSFYDPYGSKLTKYVIEDAIVLQFVSGPTALNEIRNKCDDGMRDVDIMKNARIEYQINARLRDMLSPAMHCTKRFAAKSFSTTANEIANDFANEILGYTSLWP